MKRSNGADYRRKKIFKNIFCSKNVNFKNAGFRRCEKLNKISEVLEYLGTQKETKGIKKIRNSLKK
jgi:hypothetical protein